MIQPIAFRPLAYALLGCCAIVGGSCLQASAQNTPERGVFVTQVGDSNRAIILQTNSESRARIAQDGNDNQLDLEQNGGAPHTAQIAQDGGNNIVNAEQGGDGSINLALAQEGDDNSAILLQRETVDGITTGAKVQQLGNGNRLSLVQDGSDNQAELSQVGDDNTMTATQLNAGNRLQWAQDGNGLSDLQIMQTGNSSIQITQSATGAQFAPPPGSGG